MQLTDADANGVNRRTVAVIAGISYLALFAVGIFGNFMVREQLVVADDPTATLQNLAESETLVRLAIVGFIAAFVLDVLVAWALFHVFRPAGADLSRLTCWFRIVYTVFLGVAVVFLFGALELAGDASHVVAIESAARESQAMLARCVRRHLARGPDLLRGPPRIARRDDAPLRSRASTTRRHPRRRRLRLRVRHHRVHARGLLRRPRIRLHRHRGRARGPRRGRAGHLAVDPGRSRHQPTAHRCATPTRLGRRRPAPLSGLRCQAPMADGIVFARPDLGSPGPYEVINEA